MTSASESLFQLEQVTYTYTALNTPAYVALKKLNLEIRRGEFVAIIGPSGSGKSTLMHLLGLMADPSDGVLKIHGTDVAKLSPNEKSALRNKHIGFLFQQFFLLPQLSVVENIMLPAEYAAHSQTQENVYEKAISLVKRYGLSGQEDKKPTGLSGGQRQRVALCRALMMEPDVLLCDEPTGALDSATAQEVLQTLAELNAAGRTVIVITHDSEVAERAGRIIKIVDGNIVSDSINKKTSEPVEKKASLEKSDIHASSAFLSDRLKLAVKQMFLPTWQSLKNQKLRTALTMTGLLLGVASVFIMLTLTGRVGKIFEDFFATQGSREAFVNFDHRLAEKTGAPRWRGLNAKTELPKLSQRIARYGRIEPSVSTGSCAIVSSTGNIKNSLVGLNSLQQMRSGSMRIAKGRLPMPHEFDGKQPARVALLGSDAAVKLFVPRGSGRNTTESVIGQHIVVRGCEFEGILTVIGVLEPIDTLFDRGVNSSVYIPTQTLFAGGVSLYKPFFTVVPNEGVSPTWFAKHVIGHLTVMTGNQFPFRFFAAEQELEKFNMMMGILTGLTLVIGALCTLIGGIGVMNIMLVSVHERVQEIGIRKAVGARDSHIRSQFLFESVGLCLISGGLGLLLGIVVSTLAFALARHFLPKVENLSYQLDAVALLISLAVSIGAGIAFGTWPARRAAALDVVDALKQE